MIDPRTLSAACLDTVPRSVDWGDLIVERNVATWWAAERHTHTSANGTEHELVLVRQESQVLAVYLADETRIDLSDISEYLYEVSDDEENLPDWALTEDDFNALENLESWDEGPMMNYWYPMGLTTDDYSIGLSQIDPVDAAYRLRDLPMVVVRVDDEVGLALSGGGMDLTWEICEAFIALGYLPPVHFCSLPGMAGRATMTSGGEVQPLSRASERDREIIAACRRSLEIARDQIQYKIDRLPR